MSRILQALAKLGSLLPFALYRWLFIIFATAILTENAVLLKFAIKAPQRAFQRLIFMQDYLTQFTQPPFRSSLENYSR